MEGMSARSLRALEEREGVYAWSLRALEEREGVWGAPPLGGGTLYSNIMRLHPWGVDGVWGPHILTNLTARVGPLEKDLTRAGG